MNTDFYKKILTSKEEYWVVVEKIYKNSERSEDRIMFILISDEIERGKKVDEILLTDVEKLEKTYVDENIFLSEDYPPFQTNMSFHNIYEGFAVKENIKEFLKKAIQIESNLLGDYEKIYEELLQEEEK